MKTEAVSPEAVHTICLANKKIQEKLNKKIDIKYKKDSGVNL